MALFTDYEIYGYSNYENPFMKAFRKTWDEMFPECKLKKGSTMQDWRNSENAEFYFEIRIKNPCRPRVMIKPVLEKLIESGEFADLREIQLPRDYELTDDARWFGVWSNGVVKDIMYLEKLDKENIERENEKKVEEEIRLGEKIRFHRKMSLLREAILDYNQESYKEFLTLLKVDLEEMGVATDKNLELNVENDCVSLLVNAETVDNGYVTVD